MERANTWWNGSRGGGEKRRANQQHVIMAPVHLEHMFPGWSMNRLLEIIQHEETDRYADAADKLIIRIQFWLIKDTLVPLDAFDDLFEGYNEVRFQIQEARQMS